jgi:hypothetical protein
MNGERVLTIAAFENLWENPFVRKVDLFQQRDMGVFYGRGEW